MYSRHAYSLCPDIAGRMKKEYIFSSFAISHIHNAQATCYHTTQNDPISF
jgi:hypothetical protein